MDLRVSSPLGAAVYAPTDTSCGRMHVQMDGYLYVGQMADLTTQRHSATIYLALAGDPFTIRTLKTPPLQAAAAVVGSGVHKRFVGGDATIVSVDVSPTNRSFRALAAMNGRVHEWPRADFAPEFDALVSFSRGDMGHLEASELFRRMVDVVARALPAVKALDPRVRQVMRLLRERPHIRVDELAATVGLSREWLLHLFKQEAGITLRRYEQTLKLQAAAAYLQRGVSLTQVAASAGFADLSHFSKLWKLHYGFAPQRSFAGPELTLNARPSPACFDLRPPAEDRR